MALPNNIFKLMLVSIILTGCAQKHYPLVAQKETSKYQKIPSKINYKESKKLMGHGLIEQEIKKSIAFSASNTVKNRRSFKLKNISYYFMDANEGFVLELLGRAQFTRFDFPAKILQFEGEKCFLDLFFYKSKNEFRVNHISVRSKEVKKTRDEDCFLNLVSAHNK